MAGPLLKGSGEERSRRGAKLAWLVDRCAAAGIARLVLPFVDDSAVAGDAEVGELVAFLKSNVPAIAARGMELHLETSLPPKLFAFVLGSVNHPALKVNYDSGNSSSLGFDCDEEFAAYGRSIGSIHIKDRVLGGATVPLGAGDADFDKLARNVKSVGYRGDFILQVARGAAGDELCWARRNREFVEILMARGG
jgi:hexulose-6-phosphate isomerase